MWRWLWPKAGVTTALCLVLTLFISTGVRGVGFGSMWDEGLQLEGLKRSVQTVSITQTGYYYGGLYYVPGYLLLAPQFLRQVPLMLQQMRELPSRPFDATKYPAIVEAQQRAMETLASPSFVERERSVFVGFVSLTILAVFWASYLVNGSLWAAFTAAAAVGLSWELSYHSRWIAVDSLLGLCGALALGCVCGALSASATPTQSRSRFRWAAFAAGIGMGCKLPGLFLSVPVLLGLALSPHSRGLRAWLPRVLEAVCLMAAVFVAANPGVLLDPLHYANDMFRVESDYNLIDDDPYCVPSFGLRLAKIAGYWALVSFSPFWPVAAGLAALVVWGAFVGVRELQPKLLAVLAFVLVYSCFVATQRLLIVRNLMVTLPPLAILLSVGVQRCAWFLARFRAGPALLGTLLASGGLMNARWSWQASGSVGTTTSDSILERFEAEVLSSQHPGLYVSPDLRAALRARGSLPESRLKLATWDAATEVALYADALPGWKANVPLYAHYFASLHANYDYYPGLLGWSGLKKMGEPVVLLSKAKLLELGIKKAPQR